MKYPPRTLEHYEGLIAGLLWYGSWIAVAITCVSLVMGLFGSDGMLIAKAGIALFILLPVARVALMIVIFARARDPIYTMISALVLAIIVAGFIAGR